MVAHSGEQTEKDGAKGSDGFCEHRQEKRADGEVFKELNCSVIGHEVLKPE